MSPAGVPTFNPVGFDWWEYICAYNSTSRKIWMPVVYLMWDLFHPAPSWFSKIFGGWIGVNVLKRGWSERLQNP